MIVQDALEIIKRWEGVRLRAYRDRAGYWTIGVGHLIEDQSAGLGMTITEAEADELLRKDLAEAVDAVRDACTRPVTANQLGALASFVFNLGEGALNQSSLLRLHNDGCRDPNQLRHAFGLWCKVKNPKTGLLEFSQPHYDRRMQEASLYMAPDTVAVPAIPAAEALPEGAEQPLAPIEERTIAPDPVPATEPVDTIDPAATGEGSSWWQTPPTPAGAKSIDDEQPPAAPAPSGGPTMLPLLAALIPTLLDAAPRLMALFPAKGEVAARNQKIAQVLADTAKSVTQQATLEGATTAIAADKDLAAKFEAAALAQADVLAKLLAAEDQSRQAAREFARSYPAMPRNWPVEIVTYTILAYFGLSLAVSFYRWDKEIVASMLDTMKNITLIAVGFWLGSSFGSRVKDKA